MRRPSTNRWLPLPCCALRSLLRVPRWVHPFLIPASGGRPQRFCSLSEQLTCDARLRIRLACNQPPRPEFRRGSSRSPGLGERERYGPASRRSLLGYSGFLRVALIVLIAAVLLAPWRCAFCDGIRSVRADSSSCRRIRRDVVIRPSAMLDSRRPRVRRDKNHIGRRRHLHQDAGSRLARSPRIRRGLPIARRNGARTPGAGTPRSASIRFTGLIAFLLGAAGVVAFAIVLASARGLDGLSLFLRGRSAELRDALAVPSFYPWAATLVVVPSTIVVATVAWARGSWRFTLLALVLAAAVFLRALPTGNRLLLLPFLGALFVLYFVRRRTRPGFVTLIAIAAVAITASAVLSDLRGRGDRDESALTSVRNVLLHPARAVAPFTTGPDTEMAATLAAALEVIPAQQSHSLGATIFGDLATRPIPRPLWEEKPAPPRQKLIATIWPVEAKRGTLNPAFSALLYFFWDLSYAGVLLGLALYGILARALFQYYSLHCSLLPVQVFFALALWFLPLALRDSPVDTTINLTFGLAPIPFVFWLGGFVERRLNSRRLLT